MLGGTAIEGSDVFSLNGQTRSKFYSSVQFYKDQVHGVTGSGVGVYMVCQSLCKTALGKTIYLFRSCPAMRTRLQVEDLSSVILTTRVRKIQELVEISVLIFA